MDDWCRFFVSFFVFVVAFDVIKMLLLIPFIQRYSPLSSRLTALLSHVIQNVWLAFHSAFLNIHRRGVLTALFGCYMVGATWNCCGLGTGSRIGRAYVCIAVTCHLQFWKNDRDLWRATALARGWIGYRNMSQHRKLALETKIVQFLFSNVDAVFDVMVLCRTAALVFVQHTCRYCRSLNWSRDTGVKGL